LRRSDAHVMESKPAGLPFVGIRRIRRPARVRMEYTQRPTPMGATDLELHAGAVTHSLGSSLQDIATTADGKGVFDAIAVIL